MAGYYQREVLEPSGKEKVAAIAALLVGLAGMYFALAYSYVYINCAVLPTAGVLVVYAGTWRRGLRRPVRSSTARSKRAARIAPRGRRNTAHSADGGQE